MEQQELERIARVTLRELGVTAPDLRVAQVLEKPGLWLIEIRGNRRGPSELRIKCGPGSTPHWVREQIVTQYTGN